MEAIDEDGKVVVYYPYPTCKKCLNVVGYCIAGTGECPFANVD